MDQRYPINTATANSSVASPLIPSGTEILQPELGIMADAAALADDRVLAEMLRPPFFTGANLTKYVIPFGTQGFFQFAPAWGTVAPNQANGSVQVNPFRAIVGPRSQVSFVQGSPGTLKNWNDIRSGIYYSGTGGSGAGVALAANASGFARWDLIYATLTLDVFQSSVIRKIKPPSATTVGSQQVPQATYNVVTVNVVTGTPGASPNFPSLPADVQTTNPDLVGSTYNMPLAYVRVPNGFGASSTVDPRDIFEAAPTFPIARSFGGAASFMPANQQFKPSGTILGNANYAWTPTPATRPPIVLPPTMIGMESVAVQLDLRSSSQASNSHPNAGVIDDSRDWSKRHFRVVIQAMSSINGDFASNDGASSGSAMLPGVNLAATQYFQCFGQSMKNDMASFTSGLGSNGGAVASVTPTQLAQMAASSQMTIYVDYADNKLKVYYTTVNQPGVRFYVWIDASAPMANW